MAATSTFSHRSRSLSYDRHIIKSFIDVEVEEFIEHVGDIEEEEWKTIGVFI